MTYITSVMHMLYTLQTRIKHCHTIEMTPQKLTVTLANNVQALRLNRERDRKRNKDQETGRR